MFVYSIRRAHPDEALSLSALALRSKAYWGYSTEFIAACREELSYTAEQIRGNEFRFFVAEHGGALTGFYALRSLAAAAMELEALFVDPSYIGKGFGRALIDHAKCTAAELGAVTLIVQGDPHAERFYRAAGGKRTGQQESASIPGRYLPTFAIALTDS